MSLYGYINRRSTKMSEELDRLCAELKILLSNPYAVERYHEKRTTTANAWAAMAKQHKEAR